MAYRFKPSEPIIYHNFDYEKFLDFSIANSLLKELPFIKEWKDKWLSVLIQFDNDIKEYIESHPDTNPMLERAKSNPLQFRKRNEMFIYEFISPITGSFYFHYDVEKIKRLAEKNKLQKITLHSYQFYLDTETIYEKSRKLVIELPIFAPIFAVSQQYVVVDGNKRIMAKMLHGENSIDGFAMSTQQTIESFFFDLDRWFYQLLREMSLFVKMVHKGLPFSAIKTQSIIF